MDNDSPQEPSPSPSAHHIPVLLREVLDALDLEPGLTVVDGTLGAAGHSQHILKRIGPEGLLIGLDRDPMMLGLARSVIQQSNAELHHASYAELPAVLETLQIGQVDRILLDLGLSSDQLADRARGFGFQTGGPLDLRFDPSSGRPAHELLACLDADELTRIFETFGEERFSRAIAHEIVASRKTTPVNSAEDLVAAVAAAVPGKFQRTARKHPATRVFQALRIAVNDELGHLECALNQALPNALAPGGRLVIITFHSLEDRLVKQAFRGSDQWQSLTQKPITATRNEQRINPRSRTAKLRAAIRK